MERGRDTNESFHDNELIFPTVSVKWSSFFSAYMWRHFDYYPLLTEYRADFRPPFCSVAHFLYNWIKNVIFSLWHALCLFFSFFWDGVLLLLPRLECHDVSSAHRNLHLGSGNSLASASWVAGITGMCHHVWLIFVFLVEMVFRHVAQADLELWAQAIHLP